MAAKGRKSGSRKAKLRRQRLNRAGSKAAGRPDRGGHAQGAAHRKNDSPPAETPMMRKLREASDARYRLMHPDRAADEEQLRRQRLKMIDSYGHKVNGTPETHNAASRQRPGALLRLWQSGAIDRHQLGWAEEIAVQHARIGADVSVRSGSLERVDHGRLGDEVFFESLAAVRRAWAYSRWREALLLLVRDGTPAPILAMVIEDCGVVEVARRFGMGRGRLERLLIDALDLWPRMLADARRNVDEGDVIAIERRLAS